MTELSVSDEAMGQPVTVLSFSGEAVAPDILQNEVLNDVATETGSNPISAGR